MPDWLVNYRHVTVPCPAGELEGRLRKLRHEFGVDEFTVTAASEDVGRYVPELERGEVPDTLPEEWGQ